MDPPTLHLHETRLGAGLPARTVRPWRRRGDGLLGAFRRALAEAAGRVVLTGMVFERADPPAHLANRVVAPLAALAARGIPVLVPPGTPRTLLFLAAGVGLGTAILPGRPREFWRSGEYRLVRGDAIEVRRVPVPGAVGIGIDVTGLSAKEFHGRLRERLRRLPPGSCVRVGLTGVTEEPEILSFGARELRAHLSRGMEGAVRSEVGRPAPEEREPPGEDRAEALRRAREGLPDLPAATGVYEFLDGRGRVLYVGKAVDTRRRVASHYTAEVREASPRGPMLLAARSVRFRPVASEVEALLLEADRIRESRPPYNRQMKARESYRYLRADLAGPLPSLTSETEAEEDGAEYCGPFPKRWVVERALRVLQVVYGLAPCAWRPGSEPPAACTERALGVCAAPCRGGIEAGRYRDRVRRALAHLRGGDRTPPAFGTLNAPEAGLLGAEDLRVLAGFGRSFRRLLANLREANGGVDLGEGRVLLVLGGLRAGLRKVRPGRENEAEAWIRRRAEAFRELPPRTWVTPAQADEVRILSSALRRRPFLSLLPEEPARR